MWMITGATFLFLASATPVDQRLFRLTEGDARLKLAEDTSERRRDSDWHAVTPAPATYVIGVLGFPLCPPGSVGLETEQECDDAWQALNVPAYNGERLNGHRDRMPGCWIGRGGKANWNANLDFGIDSCQSTLICKWTAALPGSADSTGGSTDYNQMQNLWPAPSGTCSPSGPTSYNLSPSGGSTGPSGSMQYPTPGSSGSSLVGSSWSLSMESDSIQM